jgi:hypothetical protein
MTTPPYLNMGMSKSTPIMLRPTQRSLLTLASSSKEIPSNKEHSEPGALMIGGPASGQGGAKPLIISEDASTTTTPQASTSQAMAAPEGAVKKRVAEIKGVAKSVECMQPPSLYILTTSKLEVWTIPGHSPSTPRIVFYKVPQVQHCDFVLESPNPNHATDEALTTMKAEPRMVRLLEKAGITLDPNNRMTPPPAVCEQW